MGVFESVTHEGSDRFGRKIKLSNWYIGLYEILKCFLNVAYELDLPSNLVIVHPIFNVFILNKCIGDPYLTVLIECNEVRDSLSYDEIDEW